MAKKQQYGLDPDTPLKLIAIQKQTFKEFEKEITYGDWISFKRNKNYYYRAVKI